MTELRTQFETAAVEAQSLSKRPANKDLLSLYAFYKQATRGDVSGRRPGMFDMAGGAKFDAWKKLKGMHSEDAMQSYIKLVGQLQQV